MCTQQAGFARGRHQPAAPTFILSLAVAPFSSRESLLPLLSGYGTLYSRPGAKHLTKESQSALAILRSWWLVQGQSCDLISTENAGTRWLHCCRTWKLGREKAWGDPGAAHWAWLRPWRALLSTPASWLLSLRCWLTENHLLLINYWFICSFTPFIIYQLLC